MRIFRAVATCDFVSGMWHNSKLAVAIEVAGMLSACSVQDCLLPLVSL